MIMVGMKTNTLPAKQTDPTVRCQELGDELLRLRKTAHLSVRQVAHITCIDQSIVTRFEKGQRPPTGKQLRSLLTAYRADRPTRQRIETLAEEASQPDWWQRDRKEPTERQHTLINLEAHAESIVSFEPLVVPGLLQTGEYARTLIAEADVVSQQGLDTEMAVRFSRHSVLEQWKPPTLLAIIDELALHRIVGDADVMRQQLDYLVQCAGKRGIEIRVVPNGTHAGLIGSFEFINRPNHPAVVFVEQLASNLFIEQPSEVEPYRRAIERLLDQALSEAQSVEHVADLATRLGTKEGP